MESRSRPVRPPPPSVVIDLSDLRSLQRCHDEAYRLIDRGLTCDEEAKLDEAKQCYMNGLREVNRLLAVNCEQIHGTQEQKDTAKSIQQKMNKTKLQIEYRLQSIVEKTQPVPQAMQTDEPPSYEESIASSDGVSNAEFVALGDSVMSEQSDTDGSLVANATEIYAIPDGVQIFFITPEGYVSAPSYPSSLKVFKFTDRNAGTSMEHPPAFLQVGSWLYPMSPGTTPVLQSNYGAYIFPDLSENTPGNVFILLHSWRLIKCASHNLSVNKKNPAIIMLFATRPHSAVGNVSGNRCQSDCRSRGRQFDPGPVPYFRGD